MTPEVVLQLHPPRLPEAFATLGPADLATAFGAGLVLSALVLTVAAPLLRRRPARPALSARIAAARILPPEERLLALTQLLAERGVVLPGDQRRALYTGAADPARLEALIRATRRPRWWRR